MSKPTGMSDVEWGLRCDLAAAFRLSVRFGFNEGHHEQTDWYERR